MISFASPPCWFPAYVVPVLQVVLIDDLNGIHDHARGGAVGEDDWVLEWRWLNPRSWQYQAISDPPSSKRMYMSRRWYYIPDPDVVQVEVVPGDDALRLEQNSPPGLRIRSVWMADAKPFLFSVFFWSSLLHAPQRPGLHLVLDNPCRATRNTNNRKHECHSCGKCSRATWRQTT